jgi:hypothetical protein
MPVSVKSIKEAPGSRVSVPAFLLTGTWAMSQLLLMGYGFCPVKADWVQIISEVLYI